MLLSNLGTKRELMCTGNEMDKGNHTTTDLTKTIKLVRTVGKLHCLGHVLQEVSGNNSVGRPYQLPRRGKERLLAVDLHRLGAGELVVLDATGHEQRLLPVHVNRLQRLNHLEHSVGVLDELSALEELLGQALQVQDLRLLDLLRGRDERLDRSSHRGGVRRRLRHLHRRSIGRRERVQLMLGQEVLQLLQRNHLRLLLRDLGELLNLLHLGLVLRHRRLLLGLLLLLLLLLALLLGLRLLLLLLLGGSYGRSLLLLDSLLVLLHLLGLKET